MNQFDVVGFGALNVDKLYLVDKIATSDEQRFIIGFKETCGGSAANTIVGLARLGCKVGFIGKVADDREGKLLLEDFYREGVDTGGVILEKKGKSGTAIGFIDKKGERILYINPGVNDSIGYEEINKNFAFRTKFLHLTSFVGEKSFRTQEKLVRTLPKNVKISFDPQQFYARKGLEALTPILKRTFLLVLNVKELEILSKKPDYREGAETLIREGVKIIAVKLGSKGCYVTDGKENHHVEAFKVKVVDTTGAGDAFCVGFLYGLIKHKTLKECGKIGNFIASWCIRKIGARTGLPYYKDIKTLIR